VAHVLKGHLNNGQIVVVDEPSKSPTSAIEEEADELAASWVLPKRLGRIPDRISQDWINSTSADQGIHPIVLVGRLQNENVIPWSTTLVRNAPSVLSELELW
jgi:HTH-type transcriptional regulator/antitoxin HigA